MIKFKLYSEKFESDVDDQFFYLNSLEDFCSSPTPFYLSTYLEIYTFEDIFCGVKIRLDKLNATKKLESIILVDEYNFEVDLATFIDSFI